MQTLDTIQNDYQNLTSMVFILHLQVRLEAMGMSCFPSMSPVALLYWSFASMVTNNSSNSTSRHHQSGSLQSFASSDYSISPISSQLSTPVASPAASLNRPNNAVSARKRITFADHDTAYSAESFAEDNEQNSEDSSQRKQTRTTTPLLKPTPAVTKHLYPPHRHPAKRTDSMKALKQLSSSLDGWTSKGEKANVKMYIRMQSSGQQPLLRGDGIIEGGWTAEQLCSVVHCFGARKICETNQGLVIISHS